MIEVKHQAELFKSHTSLLIKLEEIEEGKARRIKLSLLKNISVERRAAENETDDDVDGLLQEHVGLGSFRKESKRVKRRKESSVGETKCQESTLLTSWLSGLSKSGGERRK